MGVGAGEEDCAGDCVVAAAAVREKGDATYRSRQPGRAAQLYREALLRLPPQAWTQADLTGYTENK